MGVDKLGDTRRRIHDVVAEWFTVRDREILGNAGIRFVQIVIKVVATCGYVVLRGREAFVVKWQRIDGECADAAVIVVGAGAECREI